MLCCQIREEDTNAIPENYEEKEHVVEFSVTMVVPGYSAILKAESLQYNQITQDLTARVCVRQKHRLTFQTLFILCMNVSYKPSSPGINISRGICR